MAQKSHEITFQQVGVKVSNGLRENHNYGPGGGSVLLSRCVSTRSATRRGYSSAPICGSHNLLDFLRNTQKTSVNIFLSKSYSHFLQKIIDFLRSSMSFHVFPCPSDFLLVLNQDKTKSLNSCLVLVLSTKSENNLVLVQSWFDKSFFTWFNLGLVLVLTSKNFKHQLTFLSFESHISGVRLCRNISKSK